MYYNVVIKEPCEYTGMVFHFGDDFERALEFAKNILTISEYSVEILQLPKEPEV